MADNFFGFDTDYPPELGVSIVNFSLLFNVTIYFAQIMICSKASTLS